MKALLLKDIYMLKNFTSIITLACILLYAWILGLYQVYTVNEISMGMSTLSMFLGPLMVVIFSISFLNMVGGTHNAFWASLPYSKKSRACEIYIILSFIAISVLIASTVGYVVCGYVFERLAFTEYISLIFETSFILFLSLARYGLDASLRKRSDSNKPSIRCALYAVAVVTVRFAINKFLPDTPIWGWGIIAALSLVVFAVSWIISVKFYKEKEVKA